MSLILEKKALENMKAHAEEDYPNECCGFLYGRDGDERQITLSKRAVNHSEGNQRRRFRIDPNDYRKAEKFAQENDLDLLGIYHSHPDHPAEPSEHDRAVAMPFFSYIIIPVQKGRTDELRSWRLNEDRQFDEEPVLHQKTEVNQ